MTTLRRFAAALLSVAGLATVLDAHAATVVLDGGNGAVYDAVGDGWSFAGGPPTPPPPDGTGDAAGQPLSVGFITNVLEIRAMAEFALLPLAGVAANDVTSATLTITVDDVIGTFGPGASFDGTASTPIAIGTYAGDGAVTTSDFSTPTTLLGQITPGAITDATLANTGAVAFNVDVTSALKAAITAAETSFGIRMSTADTPTATSLDDMAPPGVAGGRLPFITVDYVVPVTTTTTTVASTTTTTTIAPTTTTVPPTTTSTTSTTTSIPSSTTSTTVPEGCATEATFESIRCRLEEVATTVAGEPSLAGVGAKMSANVEKALALLDRAEAGDAKAARSALRKIGTRVRAIGRPLRSLKGRRTIDGQVRLDLLSTLDGLSTDVRTKMKSS